MSGLFNPTIWWAKQLPHDIRPNEDKIEKLEKLRSRAVFGILPLPNNMFVAIVLSSAWATRSTQENIYARAKEEMPNASEKELLEAVLRSRISPQNPVGLKMTEDEIDKEMRNINSLNDLIEYFVQRDKEEPRFLRDLFGTGERIANKVNKILER